MTSPSVSARVTESRRVFHARRSDRYQLESILDGLYHLTGWIWGVFLGGGVLVGVVLALAQAGLSGLAQWQLVQVAMRYPGEAVAAAAGLFTLLLLLTFVGYRAHRLLIFHLRLTMRPVRAIELDDLTFKLGPDPREAYFERGNSLAKAREALQRAADHGPGGTIGLFVFGMPMVGKTRLVLETLRREPKVKRFQLLVWPARDAAPSLESLNALRGERIVLLLDDLQEYARREEAGFVLAAIAKARQVASRVVIVATSRGGTDLVTSESEFGALIQRLSRVALRPMDPDEEQIFRQAMIQQGVTVDDGSDGTPGSILLGLGRRTIQVLDERFPADARKILQSLALLRAAEAESYTVQRVRRVAIGVFDFPPASSVWRRGLGYLVDDSWVTVSGETIAIRTDAYLDRCVAAFYPIAGQTLEGDFAPLEIALSTVPVDAAALFSLSDGVRHSETRVGGQAEAGEMALRCVQTGLSSLTKSRSPALYARGNVSLGLAYVTRAEGDPATLGDPVMNLELALRAFDEAIEVYSSKVYQINWAEAVYNRAVVRTRLAQLLAGSDGAACEEHRARAIDELESTLDVFSSATLRDKRKLVESQIRILDSIQCE
jgi:hypothetical protein